MKQHRVAIAVRSFYRHVRFDGIGLRQRRRRRCHGRRACHQPEAAAGKPFVGHQTGMNEFITHGVLP
jgi:hypothetical protein